MRVLWLTGALASVVLMAGCETTGAAHGRHGPQGPHDHAMHEHAAHEHAKGGHRMEGHRMHGGGMMGGPMMGGPMMGAPDPAAMQAWLDRAKAEIAVTAEQEAAWTAYVEAINANRAARMEHREEMREGADAAQGAHLPDKMQTHLEMMSAHLASMRQLQAAVAALYAQLTEEQRVRADSALSLRGRHARRQGDRG